MLLMFFWHAHQIKWTAVAHLSFKLSFSNGFFLGFVFVRLGTRHGESSTSTLIAAFDIKMSSIFFPWVILFQVHPLSNIHASKDYQ
jgi:hypothetical protein